jgi:hypothetical protein
MPAPSRIEESRRVRKGERTLVVRVIEYPEPLRRQPKRPG